MGRRRMIFFLWSILQYDVGSGLGHTANHLNDNLAKRLLCYLALLGRAHRLAIQSRGLCFATSRAIADGPPQVFGNMGTSTCTIDRSTFIPALCIDLCLID